MILLELYQHLGTKSANQLTLRSIFPAHSDLPYSLAVKCKSEENCAFDDKSTIFGTEIIEILRNIF